jgi:hypothetical protein
VALLHPGVQDPKAALERWPNSRLQVISRDAADRRRAQGLEGKRPVQCAAEVEGQEQV